MVAGRGRKSSEVETNASDVLISKLAGLTGWLGSDIANMPKNSPRSVRLRRLDRRLSMKLRSECRRSLPFLRLSCRSPRISPTAMGGARCLPACADYHGDEIWPVSEWLPLNVSDTATARYSLSPSQLTALPTETGPPSSTSAKA